MSDPFQEGSESLPGIKFTDIGDKVTGQITAIRQARDLDINGEQRKWPNGDDRMVWVFDMDTDEDGQADHALWVRGNMYTVVREALKEANVPTVGALVRIEHHALGTPPAKGMNAPKLFTCKAKAGPPLKPKADAFSGPADDTDDAF